MIKHDYYMEAVTSSGRKLEIYGSFSNCAEASESARASHPGLKSLTTRLFVSGRPVDSYLM